MFVRWRKRQSKRKGTVLVAELCENRRVNGKARLRYFATLGSIAADAIEHEFGDECAAFWEKVSKRLDPLSNRVSAEERERIEHGLADRVPRISKEDAYQERAFTTAIMDTILPGAPRPRVVGDFPSMRKLHEVAEMLERMAKTD